MEGILALMIPILALLIGFFSVWAHHKQKIAKIEATRSTGANIAQAEKLTSLEDRVKVLERIVTDGGYDVATQIEALRDTRSVEAQGSGVPLDMTAKEKA